MYRILGLMLRTLGNLFDTLFPPSEAARILRGHDATSLVPLLTPTHHHDTTTLLRYEAPIVRAAVTACKFEHHQLAARMLGTVFTTWIQTEPSVPTLILPIPLSAARLRKRGHNQVLTALRTSAVPNGCVTSTDMLTRVRNTPPQTSLTRHERRQNLLDAFHASPQLSDSSHTYERIILVDDVMTTGATLRAARAALSPHTNLPIICVAFAH